MGRYQRFLRQKRFQRSILLSFVIIFILFFILFVYIEQQKSELLPQDKCFVKIVSSFDNISVFLFDRKIKLNINKELINYIKRDILLFYFKLRQYVLKLAYE